MLLIDTKIKSAKPAARQYLLGDGDGLHLLIKPNGAKIWRLDHTFAGRRRTRSIGEYPTVTFARARDRRMEAKRQIAEGVDPLSVKSEA